MIVAQFSQFARWIMSELSKDLWSLALEERDGNEQDRKKGKLMCSAKTEQKIGFSVQR